jgi:hypothetical protein
MDIRGSPRREPVIELQKGRTTFPNEMTLLKVSRQLRRSPSRSSPPTCSAFSGQQRHCHFVDIDERTPSLAGESGVPERRSNPALGFNRPRVLACAPPDIPDGRRLPQAGMAAHGGGCVVFLLAGALPITLGALRSVWKRDLSPTA